MDSDKAINATGAPAPQADTPAEAPRDSEAHYEVAFEFSSECLLLTDGEGLVLKAN